MRIATLALLLLFVSPSFASNVVFCGTVVSCKHTNGDDKCSMLDGTPSYFQSSHPTPAQGDATYDLVRVSVSSDGKYRFAVCWYVDATTDDRIGFQFKSSSAHSIVPVYSGKHDEWVGDSSYKICDPNNYPCEMKAIY